MKQKKINAKLNLNKKTIANLGAPTMEKINAGHDKTQLTYCKPASACWGCETLPPLMSCDYESVCICEVFFP